MTEEHDTNIHRPEFEIIEKIKILNIKKGDVIILKYKADPSNNMPRHIYRQAIEKQVKAIKEFVKDNWGGYVGMVSIPDTIDIEIMRLEEWFV